MIYKPPLRCNGRHGQRAHPTWRLKRKTACIVTLLSYWGRLEASLLWSTPESNALIAIERLLIGENRHKVYIEVGEACDNWMPLSFRDTEILLVVLLHASVIGVDSRTRNNRRVTTLYYTSVVSYSTLQ